MMRRRRVKGLLVAGLVMHRWTRTLVAVTVVLLPIRGGHEPLLQGVRKARMRGPEPLLRGDGAAPRGRGDRVATFADADGDAAHVDGDLAGLGAAQSLRQRPNVIVGEAQGLDLGELGVFRKGGQGHAQPLQSVVQRVHPVPLAVVGLHPPVPFQPQDLSEKRSPRPLSALIPGLIATRGHYATRRKRPFCPLSWEGSPYLGGALAARVPGLFPLLVLGRWEDGLVLRGLVAHVEARV